MRRLKNISKVGSTTICHLLHLFHLNLFLGFPPKALLSQLPFRIGINVMDGFAGNIADKVLNHLELFHESVVHHFNPIVGLMPPHI